LGILVCGNVVGILGFWIRKNVCSVLISSFLAFGVMDFGFSVFDALVSVYLAHIIHKSPKMAKIVSNFPKISKLDSYNMVVG